MNDKDADTLIAADTAVMDEVMRAISAIAASNNVSITAVVVAKVEGRAPGVSCSMAAALGNEASALAMFAETYARIIGSIDSVERPDPNNTH